MADRGTWELQFFQGPSGDTSVGYLWRYDGIRQARLGLPQANVPALVPAVLKSLYCEMDGVDWMGFGCAGKLEPSESFHWASAYAFDFDPDDPNPDDLFVIGNSPSGDMIVCTKDGRGGWLSLGSHRTHLIGTIAETLDWLFGELLADRCPEMDTGGFA